MAVTAPGVTGTTTTPTNKSLGKGKLGVPAIVFMIIAASAPLTVIGGGVPSNFAVTGSLGIPFSFLVLGVVLVLFAVGYTAMSRHIQNAGAFYAYIARGLGKEAGVGAAWVALISYNAMQVGIYGLFGFATSSFINSITGGDFPWWASALIGLVLVGILGVNKVDLSAKVLGLLVGLEFLAVIVYDLFAFKVAPEGISNAGLEPASLFTTGVGAVLAFSIAAFMGFESGAIYGEEVKDPQRTAGRATFIAILIIAVFYAFSAWAMVMGAGPAMVIDTAREQGPDMVFIFLAEHGPKWVADAASLLFITSLLAALVAFHNMVARYLFSMGREGVMPGVFATVGVRSQAPVAGSLVQSALALLLLLVFAFSGRNSEAGPLYPVITFFTWLTNTGAFGLVLLMALTSFAVVGYFRNNTAELSSWTRIIAPLIAGAMLSIVFVMIVINFDVLIGLEEASILSWLLPAIVLVPGIAGAIWTWWLKGNRPALYDGIGRGGDLS